MKSNKLYLLITIVILSFISCDTSDDNDSGTGGENIPPIILANLYATSNTTGDLALMDFTTTQGVVTRNILTQSDNNQGIFYNDEEDQLTLASTTEGVLNTYNNISAVEGGSTINPFISTEVFMENPVAIAVLNNTYVVSDNTDLDNNPNTVEGRFFILENLNNKLTLRNTITVDFNVWGISFAGNDLYATIDNTNGVARFENFLSNNTDIKLTANKTIFIEGMIRAQGIGGDGTVMIVTDVVEKEGNIGANDGAFHLINDFVSKFNNLEDGGILASNQNIRVSGIFTGLGNPVAADYDASTSTVFIAENRNEGGKILFFNNLGAGGNLAPSFERPFSGASSLFFINN